MLGKLNNKVSIVTGGGQGIGAGIARIFAQAGAKVLIATRTESHGQNTLNAIRSAGGTAELAICDIGERAAVDAVVAQAVDLWGTVDIAIHNAGVYPTCNIDQLTDDVLEHTLAVNMKASLWLTQACLPHFRRQKSGRLLFTSSVTGPRVAMPGTAHYAMSKGGMNGFIRTAALEFARENITVNGVEPGYIMTAAMQSLGDDTQLNAMARCIPMGKLGAPEDIANTMLFLASDEAAYITGQTIVVDGGSTLPESQIVMDEFYGL